MVFGITVLTAGSSVRHFCRRMRSRLKLSIRIRIQEQQNQNLDLFIERIQKYSALDELTPYVAHEFIKAIYVEAPDKSSGKRRQSVHIEYDLIGFIPLNELMKQETA